LGGEAGWRGGERRTGVTDPQSGDRVAYGGARLPAPYARERLISGRPLDQIADGIDDNTAVGDDVKA